MYRLIFSLFFLVTSCTAEICPDEFCETPTDTDNGVGLVSVGSLTREDVFNSVQNGWEFVERWSDTNPGFLLEDYPPDGRGNQDGQRLILFDDPQPDSNQFLLYHAPGWDTSLKPNPVLLVHGANDNADRAWANPNELGGFGCGALICPDTGLMQHLSVRGHSVFAIGFPHKQGDNFFWTEQIGSAIEVIKAKTGAEKVDLVGWSKGAFSARMYAANVRESWGTPYAGDVNKLLLLGNPNAGFDYIFRHGWSHNFSIFSECGGAVNAPAPHTEMVCFGFNRVHPELSIFATQAGDFYPGQRQMLGRFDHIYPLPILEQDFFTTYYGGEGFFTAGFGIDVAIEQGGSLVEEIQNSAVSSSIETYLLCGNFNTIPTIHNEHTGPSDGVLFLDTCLDTTGIDNPADLSLLPVNHLELGWQTISMFKVSNWLNE